MTTANAPTLEQFQAKIRELRDQLNELNCAITHDASDAFLVEEEIESIESKIRRYSKRCQDLYGTV